MSKVFFDSFQEVDEFIEKDPTGKSWVKLDNDKGFEVTIKDNVNQKIKARRHNTLSNYWEVIPGSIGQVVRRIKSNYPNHLVIIQNGYKYLSLYEDAEFFKNNFSYQPYQWNNFTITSFPIYSKNVLQDLANMKKPYILVDELSVKKNGKTQRSISEIFPKLNKRK